MAANQDAKKIGTISVEGVKRTRRVVEHVERTILGGPSPGPTPSVWTPGVLRARVVTAIPPGTMEAPSTTGEVALWVKGSEGWAESEDDPIPVFNDHAYASSIAEDKAVKVAWIAGELWLVQADCP